MSASSPHPRPAAGDTALSPATLSADPAVAYAHLTPGMRALLVALRELTLGAHPERRLVEALPPAHTALALELLAHMMTFARLIDYRGRRKIRLHMPLSRYLSHHERQITELFHLAAIEGESGALAQHMARLLAGPADPALCRLAVYITGLFAAAGLALASDMPADAPARVNRADFAPSIDFAVWQA